MRKRTEEEHERHVAHLNAVIVRLKQVIATQRFERKTLLMPRDKWLSSGQHNGADYTPTVQMMLRK